MRKHSRKQRPSLMHVTGVAATVLMQFMQFLTVFVKTMPNFRRLWEPCGTASRGGNATVWARVPVMGCRRTCFATSSPTLGGPWPT